MKWSPVSFAAAVVALACAFQAAPAVAQTYTVTESGTWAAGTPTIPDFSAAGETWSYSFEVSVTPTALYPSPGSFNTDISDFEYTLDGIVESSVSTPSVSWLASPAGLITFGTSNGATFVLYGSQAFSGTTSDPTILSGDYTLDSSSVVTFPGGGSEFLSGFLDVPEGGAPWLYLLLGALACCGGIFLKSRAGLRMGTLS
jgi:hypothetical protein